MAHKVSDRVRSKLYEETKTQYTVGRGHSTPSSFLIVRATDARYSIISRVRSVNRSRMDPLFRVTDKGRDPLTVIGR